MRKTNVGIIGTGNIGTDLLMKIFRSDILECSIFAGQNKTSKNIIYASEKGIVTSTDGIDAICSNRDKIDIIIDATSAKAHLANLEKFRELGKFIINLTPTGGGWMCVPCINGQQSIKQKEINMITCGGQATIPLAYEITKSQCEISYIETVSTISTESAGRATRENIDEFIGTTADAMRYFSNVQNTKAIIIINSNQPPVNMRNTIYFRIKKGDYQTICEAVDRAEDKIRQYVPGYKVIVQPSFVDDVLAVTVEVVGCGDFLPSYAGNLDIITCAAIEMAEQYGRSNSNGDRDFEKTDYI